MIFDAITMDFYSETMEFDGCTIGFDGKSMEFDSIAMGFDSKSYIQSSHVRSNALKSSLTCEISHGFVTFSILLHAFE